MRLLYTYKNPLRDTMDDNDIPIDEVIYSLIFIFTLSNDLSS